MSPEKTTANWCPNWRSAGSSLLTSPLDVTYKSEQPMVQTPEPNEGQEEDRPTTTSSLPVKIGGGVQRNNVGWPPMSEAGATPQIPSFVETDACEGHVGSVLEKRRAQQNL